MCVTEKEVKEIVKETVHQVFRELGIDTKNIQETQADFHFTRRQRRGSEEASKWIKRGLMGLVIGAIPGMLWLMWEGLTKGMGQ